MALRLMWLGRCKPFRMLAVLLLLSDGKSCACERTAVCNAAASVCSMTTGRARTDLHVRCKAGVHITVGHGQNLTAHHACMPASWTGLLTMRATLHEFARFADRLLAAGEKAAEEQCCCD